MKDKAIVRKTGEILDIKRHWIVKAISIEFPEGLEHFNTILEEKFAFDIDVENHKNGDHYILSDDKEYMSDELIVGVDNIRDYKITNQIKIDE